MEKEWEQKKRIARRLGGICEGMVDLRKLATIVLRDCKGSRQMFNANDNQIRGLTEELNELLAQEVLCLEEIERVRVRLEARYNELAEVILRIFSETERAHTVIP